MRRTDTGSIRDRTFPLLSGWELAVLVSGILERRQGANPSRSPHHERARGPRRAPESARPRIRSRYHDRVALRIIHLDRPELRKDLANLRRVADSDDLQARRTPVFARRRTRLLGGHAG